MELRIAYQLEEGGEAGGLRDLVDRRRFRREHRAERAELRDEAARDDAGVFYTAGRAPGGDESFQEGSAPFAFSLRRWSQVPATSSAIIG